MFALVQGSYRQAESGHFSARVGKLFSSDVMHKLYLCFVRAVAGVHAERRVYLKAAARRPRGHKHRYSTLKES